MDWIDPRLTDAAIFLTVVAKFRIAGSASALSVSEELLRPKAQLSAGAKPGSDVPVVIILLRSPSPQ